MCACAHVRDITKSACKSLTGNKMGETHEGLGQEFVVGIWAKETHPKSWPQLSASRASSSYLLEVDKSYF